MELVYTGEEIPSTIKKSLFLAGPSLRPEQEGDIESWRNDAIQILNDIGFDGVVFIPENRGGKFTKDFDYDNQIDWEDKCLNVADCIVFWVLRDLSKDKNGDPKLPAFTTNVEFGAWASSGKIVFGAPENADKNRYLEYYANEFKVPISNSLTETLRNAIEFLGDGIDRKGGERFVPLYIWNTASFQSWYKAQTGAGNELRGAKLLYTFRPNYGKFVFLWILKVAVYITSEDRIKDNEFVLSRTDISSVLMWQKDKEILESKVLIIKEFRSPASTPDGFIRELAGGSSPKAGVDPKETATEEIYEETGLIIDNKKLQFIKARQMYGTLSSHKSHLYSYELSDEELLWLQSQKDIVHGKAEDTERTFVEIFSIKELLKTNLVDWSTLGQLLNVMYNE